MWSRGLAGPLSDHVTLVDLGSTNGAWVNGERVGMVLLEPNDIVRYGASMIVSVGSVGNQV